jgi:hypothetical protein
MQDSDQVVGRRLDANGGSNIILFRGIDPKLTSTSSKRNSDNDMLDYVRAQEQKLKLEKLKWHENNAKVLSQATASYKAPVKTKPKVVTGTVPRVNKLTASHSTKQVKSQQAAAALIENRNRKASEWLHREQHGVGFLLLIPRVFNLNLL